MLDVPFVPPDPRSTLPSLLLSHRLGVQSCIGGLLCSWLLDGVRHWEALTGDWREDDHEGSLLIPPG